MKTNQKLYMQRLITPLAERRDYYPLEPVESADAAARLTLKRGLEYCELRLYDCTEIVLDGEVLKGEPKPREGRLFVGVDQVVSPTERVVRYQQEKEYYTNPANNTAENPLLRNLFEVSASYYDDGGFEALVAEIQNDDPDTRYAVTHTVLGDYIKLDPQDLVYNSNGQKIWPLNEYVDCAPSLIPEA